MNNKKIFFNISFSLLFKAMSILSNLVLVSLYLKFLGKDLYGFWLLILNLLTWINIFDIGISNGLKNYLVNPFLLEQNKIYNRYITTAYFFNFLIIMIATIALIILIVNINISNFLNVEKINNNFLIKIIIINLIFSAINFVLSLVNQLYYACQKSYIIEIKNFLLYFINLILLYLVIVLKIKYQLLCVTIIFNLTNLILNLIFSWYIFKDKKIELKKEYYSKSCLKKLNKTGIQFFILQIVNLILLSTDNFLIANFFSLNKVTEYNIYYKIFSLILVGHQLVVLTLWTIFTQAYFEKNLNYIKKIMFKINILEIFIGIVVIILVIISPKIIKIWLGNSYDISLSLKIMLGTYIFLLTFFNNLSSFLCGINRIEGLTKMSIVSGIINLPLSIFLVKKLNFGIEGIVLGTNISLALYLIYAFVQYKKIIKELEKSIG